MLEHFRCTSSGKKGIKWGSGAQATLPHHPARPWGGDRTCVWNISGAQSGWEVVHLSKVELTCPMNWTGVCGPLGGQRACWPLDTSPKQGCHVAGRGPRGSGLITPPGNDPTAQTVQDLGSWGEGGGKFPREKI